MPTRGRAPACWASSCWPRPLLIAALPFVARPFLDLSVGGLERLSAGAVVGSFVASLLLFAPPVVLLGMVTPFAIRLAVTEVDAAGVVAGRVFALSTAGSLLGTFMPALITIPLIGTQRTLLGAAAIVGLAAAMLLGRRWLVWRPSCWRCCWQCRRASSSREPGVIYEGESRYQFIQVVQQGAGAGAVRYLYLNEGYAVHSEWRPDTVLTGGEWDMFLTLPALLGQRRRRVVMLGNAAGTTARAFGALLPGRRLRRRGARPPGDGRRAGATSGSATYPRLTVYTADARPFLQATSKRYDLIMIDAYRQPYVPFYLATREFFDLCRQRLTPGGIVALNVSTVPGDHAARRRHRRHAGHRVPAGRRAGRRCASTTWSSACRRRRRPRAAPPPRGRERAGARAPAHAAAVGADAAPRAVDAPLDRRPGAGRVDHRRHDRRLRGSRPSDPRALPADRTLTAPGRGDGRGDDIPDELGRTSRGYKESKLRRPGSSRNPVVADYKRYKAGRPHAAGRPGQVRGPADNGSTYTRYTAGEDTARGGLWLRVTKAIAVVVVCFVAVSAGMMVGFLQRTAAQVGRNDPQEVRSAKPQLAAALPRKPLNILVLGSDRRAGQPYLGARSDTLLLVRLDPQTRASRCSPCRATCVSIPGIRAEQDQRGLLAGRREAGSGGRRQLLGVPINDFVDINFNGFIKVINKLGGAYLMIDRGYYNNTAVTGLGLDRHQPRLPAPQRPPGARLGALSPRPERRFHAHRAPADVSARDEARAGGLGHAHQPAARFCRR